MTNHDRLALDSSRHTLDPNAYFIKYNVVSKAINCQQADGKRYILTLIQHFRLTNVQKEHFKEIIHIL